MDHPVDAGKQQRGHLAKRTALKHLWVLDFHVEDEVYARAGFVLF